MKHSDDATRIAPRNSCAVRLSRSNQSPADLRSQPEHDHQRLHRPARPHQQRHRIQLRQVLDQRVQRREAQRRSADEQDRGLRHVAVAALRVHQREDFDARGPNGDAMRQRTRARRFRIDFFKGKPCAAGRHDTGDTHDKRRARSGLTSLPSARRAPDPYVSPGVSGGATRTRLSGKRGCRASSMSAPSHTSRIGINTPQPIR